MIFISGLLPDFSDEVVETKKQEPLLRISYDNTFEEIDGAMQTYQQKFSGKKHTITVIAYAILTVAAIALVIIDFKNIIPYIALLFCGFNLYYNLTDGKRTRKKVIAALQNTNPEDYTAEIFEDKIEIDTVIRPKENEAENSKIAEDIVPIKNTFIFGQDMLDFAENEQSLLLIVARRQTYCFPKRCMTIEQRKKLREILSEKTEL